MFIVIVVSGTLESSSRLLWSALPFFLFVAAQPIKGVASIRAGECGGKALPQEIPN